MVVITRHEELVEVLKETKIIKGDFKIIEHATKEDVLGKTVIGILPIHLAVYAKKIIYPIMQRPHDTRGRDLSLEETRRYFKGVKTYIVKEVKE